MCFVWIWEQTAIISLYSINWLVCITETECVYCAVRTGYLNVIWVICFIWIWEQTAIISLYSINWLVCMTETECVYCAVWTYVQNIRSWRVDWQWLFYLCYRFSNIRIPPPPLPLSRVYKFVGRVSVAVWLEALPLYQPVASGDHKTKVSLPVSSRLIFVRNFEKCTRQTSFHRCQ